MKRVALVDFAQARSGDKADIATLALFAPSRPLYEALVREVTPERVRALFGRMVKGHVERFEAPNVLGLTFALHEAMDGGAGRSLRSDSLGKSYGALLLRLEVELTPEEMAVAVGAS